MAVRLASALAVVAMSVPSTATNDDAMALHAMQAADDGHHEESQLLPSPPPSPSPSALQTAVFTGGCFFKLHAAFAKVEGVSSVQMGYVGGWLRRPTQIAVQRGGSGHAEGVSLQYNASVVSFDTLLGTFFAAHDGTSLYKQGGDIGAQFRSAVWAQSTKQLKVARSKRDEMNTDRMPPIATSVNDCRPVQERPKSADPVSCEPQSFQAVEHSTLRYHCSDAVANTGILFDPAPYLDKYHKFTPAELAQINETATPKQTHTEEDKHADNGADKSDKVEEGKVEEKAAKKEGGEEEVAKKGKADQKGDEEVAKPKASKGDTGEAKAKGDGDEAPKLKAVVKTVGEADGKAHVEKTHQEAEVKETAHKAADSDEEVPRKKKTKKRKVHDDEEEETVRTTKRRTDDDDDDDDDDDAPKRKRRKRVTSDDDDDTPKKKKKKVYDDVDEEEKPKKKKKKRVRRDDDDDDTERQVKTKSSRSDDDEEAPKPKASLKHAKDTSDDDDEAKVKSKRKSKRDDTDDAQENRAPVKKPSRSAEADESNTKADQKGDEEVAKKGKADQKGDEEVVKPKASKGDTGEAKAKGDGDEAPKLKAVVKTVGEADGKAGVEKTRQEAEVKDTAHKAAAEGGSKASQGGGEKAKEAPVKQAAGEEMHADSAKQGEADSAKKSAEAKEDALLEARAKRRSAEDVEEEMIVRGQAATAGKDRPGAVVEDSKADDAAVADAESKQKGDKGDKTPPLTRKTSSHDDVMLDV